MSEPEPLAIVVRDAMTVPCPRCDAQPGAFCHGVEGVHIERAMDAMAEQEEQRWVTA